MTITLCPAQRQAFNELMTALPASNIVTLHGDPGMGKTTVLREVHAAIGGAFLTMKELVDALRPRHPFSLEETFEQWLMEALTAHDCVILDDLHLITNATRLCLMNLIWEVWIK
jgi:DNA replication protein DnaC